MRGVTSCSPSALSTGQEEKGLNQKLKDLAGFRKGWKTLEHVFDMLSRISFPHVFNYYFFLCCHMMSPII